MSATVTFGNVGTEDRLDFTVIGSGRQSRRTAGGPHQGAQVPVLASADFNEVCIQPLKSLGTHHLRGVSEPVEVFHAADD